MSWNVSEAGVRRRVVLPALLLALSCPAMVQATVPYGGLAGGTPGIGPGLASPKIVPGKEYSHDADHMITAVGTAPLPEQVVAWDGSGGVANGVNFTGERPSFTPRSQIDAIANSNDFLFRHVQEERAHLIWSFDDLYHAVLPGGVVPMTLAPTGPSAIGLGGAAELNYELGTYGGANPPSTQGLWAAAPDVNAMPTPGAFRDVDGVEVWGPEPAFTADADKYSIDIDAFTTGPTGAPVSVWNSPSGTPYVSHAAIATAVTSLLGPVSGFLPNDGNALDGDAAINLDALMVRDLNEKDIFDRDPSGDALPDEIIFSIRQIIDPSSSTGFYATGSELFVLDAAGSVSFLKHGGHAWDPAYAMSAFGASTPNGRWVYDLNAVEAIGESVVPEPAAAGLALLSLVAVSFRRRK